MCRGARSAHGSRSAEHRHSRKNPGTARKTRSRPVGATLSDVQHHRTGREERPPNRQRPSSRRSTPARAGKSSLTEAPLPSDEAAPPQPAREDRTLGPAGRGASAAPPHKPGRTRPAQQRPSAPAPARSPNPTRTPRKTAPTAPIPDPGPRTPDPDGKGPLGPFAMSRGSLPNSTFLEFFYQEHDKAPLPKFFDFSFALNNHVHIDELHFQTYLLKLVPQYALGLRYIFQYKLYHH